MPERRVPFVAVIVAVQAVWLAVLMGPGWYSGPDLANISYAHGRALDADYLTASLGGHFGAPTRLTYWVLVRIDPLGWGLTVAARVLLQAVGTLLLWALLTELVGRRRWLPLVLAGYALSPVLVPGLSVLSSGMGLEIAQATYLGMLLLHVRYTRQGGTRRAVGVGVLALVSLLYADQIAPGMLALPWLSFVVLSGGRPLAVLRRRWPEYAVLALAAAAFGGLYLSGDYSGVGSSFGAGQAWDLVRTEWVDVLGPALLGGPWDWAAPPGVWSSIAVPPLAEKVLGQVALIGLLVASFRVTGLRALRGWALPVMIAVGGVLLVGAGRSVELGTFVSPILRYSHYAPMALAIGITLAFAAVPEEGVVERPLELPAEARPIAALVVSGALVMSVVSASGFADRFWQNTAPGYVDAVAASARTTTQQVFDPPVPASVIPPVEPNHFVSDVLKLTGGRLRFDGLEPEPLTFDDSGRAVPAGFLPAADFSDTASPGCGLLITGTTVVHLGPVLANSWDLQLQVVQRRSNAFRIEVRDAAGHLMPFRHGASAVQPTQQLVGVNRPLPYGTPSTVTLVVDDPAASFCLAHAYLGSPFPK